MKIFFDGGLRPGGMEYAVVMGGQARIVRDLGPGTSMTAEWLALIAATQAAHEAGLTDALLLGDAAAVVAQATGKIRVPPRISRISPSGRPSPPAPLPAAPYQADAEFGRHRAQSGPSRPPSPVGEE
ncbi:hypothetical protein GCM10020258_13150 [Sphingomonas yabuuchiae]